MKLTTVLLTFSLASLSLTLPLSLGRRDGIEVVSPLIVVSTSILPVGDRECKTWRVIFNATTNTFAPECRVWISDDDNSTADNQVLELQTVRLAQEGKACEAWHVEVHDG